MLVPGLLASDSLTSVYILLVADAPESISLFMSETVILLVDSLYAEAIDDVKSWANFISFFPRVNFDSR
jgi:hypothetical protein